MNLIMAGGYVAVGLVAMAVLSVLGDGLIGITLGLLVILIGGLSHEMMLRGEAHRRTARAVVGLRDSVDRASKGVEGIERIEGDIGRAKSEAQGAKTAAEEAQTAASAATEEVKSLREEYNATKEVVARFQEFQQSVSGDVDFARQSGEQLRAELNALQQQQSILQQQIQHVQSMIAAGQHSYSAAPAAAPMPQAPPVPPPAAQEYAPQEYAPREPQEPQERAAPPPPPRPAQEEQQPVAPAAAGLTGAALQNLADQIGAASSDSLVDNSLRAIADALQADAVDLYAEPIVTLPERKPAHVECYGGVRAPDGSALTIDEKLDLSGREQIMTAIENALMARCLDHIATLDMSTLSGGGCFYNVAGVSLADRSFFSALIRHLETNSELARKLVLEFPQAALMEHGEQAVEDLVRINETGARFSIDEITDLEIDFESLVGFGFSFIKVGSKFIRVQANQADDPETVRGLAPWLKGIGIEAVVENVETDLSLVELIGFDIGLGQGPLFGQPSLVPA